MESIQKLMCQLLLPAEVNNYFTIVDIKIKDQVVEMELEENDVYQHPEEGHTYEKNGFYEAANVQDFPLRDKKTILKIKRRRWIDTTTGKSVGNNYKLMWTGTRYSKEFGDFLKELDGDKGNDSVLII